MTLWKSPISLELLRERCRGTLSEYLGITFVEIGNDHLIAHMPITHNHLQPEGILHGGASAVFAETVGSIGAYYALDQRVQGCVGLELNINHIKTAQSGLLIGTGTPNHIGRTTQVWTIDIRDQEHHLIALSRLTVANLNLAPAREQS